MLKLRSIRSHKVKQREDKAALSRFLPARCPPEYWLLGANGLRYRLIQMRTGFHSKLDGATITQYCWTNTHLCCEQYTVAKLIQRSINVTSCYSHREYYSPAVNDVEELHQKVQKLAGKLERSLWCYEVAVLAGLISGRIFTTEGRGCRKTGSDMSILTEDMAQIGKDILYKRGKYRVGQKSLSAKINLSSACIDLRPGFRSIAGTLSSLQVAEQEYYQLIVSISTELISSGLVIQHLSVRVAKKRKYKKTHKSKKRKQQLKLETLHRYPRLQHGTKSNGQRGSEIFATGITRSTKDGKEELAGIATSREILLEITEDRKYKQRVVWQIIAWLNPGGEDPRRPQLCDLKLYTLGQQRLRLLAGEKLVASRETHLHITSIESNTRVPRAFGNKTAALFTRKAAQRCGCGTRKKSKQRGRAQINTKIVIQICRNDFHPESIPKVPWESPSIPIVQPLSPDVYTAEQRAYNEEEEEEEEEEERRKKEKQKERKKGKFRLIISSGGWKLELKRVSAARNARSLKDIQPHGNSDPINKRNGSRIEERSLPTQGHRGLLFRVLSFTLCRANVIDSKSHLDQTYFIYEFHLMKRRGNKLTGRRRMQETRFRILLDYSIHCERASRVTDAQSSNIKSESILRHVIEGVELTATDKLFSPPCTYVR
ncbi:hypothetical protein WN51_00883 [Melipona quadrifasciata]|uniref:Uncharacterized protein n=1 Tax=Melipona quadrifasciata TaxID=166423 RepID=A0A0M9AB66_9HYME|nr:hypothetical protein WN51_00883 [Melipona quadrifasciata]